MYIKSRGKEKRNEFRVREREQEVRCQELGTIYATKMLTILVSK